MWRRSCVALGVSALMVATAIAPTGAALAASTTWTIRNSPNVTLPGGEIRSMSCLSATSCTAVGSFLNTSGITDTLAEAWNGTAWQKQATPNPASDTTPAVSPALLGVSCPVARFCEAVGGYQNGPTGINLAEVWNGTSWKIQSVPSPAGSTSAALFAVSCTSATFCEAVGVSDSGSGEMPLAEVWNGTSWSAQAAPSPSGQFIVRLTGVSCVSPTFCEATGNSPPFAEMWNGTSWALQAMPGSMRSVSCVSATFCEAVGSVGTGGGAVWNGTSWTAQTIPGPSSFTSASLGAVSCTSANACEAVGSYATSTSNPTTFSLGEAWNGTSWTLQTTPNPAGVTFTTLDAVSCAAANSCEAGGSFEQTPQAVRLQALAEAWNGTAWALQNAVAPPGAIANAFNGVSCVSAASCEAVGTATDSLGNLISLAEIWNGTSWKIQAVPTPAQASSGVRATMDGVSCVSASFCEAVGFSAAVPGPGAWKWNGTSWTAQAVPGSSGLGSVSCTSATFCLAVGGNGEVETWNGSAWSLASAIPGFSSASSVSCVSATACEAVGLGPSSTQAAAAWNGTAWSVQTTPLPADGSDMALHAVSCVRANSCEAVGFYFTNTTFEQLTLAERLNGSRWAVQDTPNPPGSTVNNLLGVWCTSASSCHSVGEQTPSFATFTLAQVWNGASWTTQSTANRSQNDLNVLNSVWCGVSGGCTAVGIGADLGEVNATLVETAG
jgi:hypothetical protein